jgi:hypothetical protein
MAGLEGRTAEQLGHEPRETVPFLQVVKRIVAPLGLRVEATSPWWTRDFRTVPSARRR